LKFSPSSRHIGQGLPRNLSTFRPSKQFIVTDMTTDTQKVEAKGTAQHQEFAQRDAQTDNFQMAVMDDGEEDLKGSKDERVHMTDEQVSRISSNLFRR
jgi:hypothetical protein